MRWMWTREEANRDCRRIGLIFQAVFPRRRRRQKRQSARCRLAAAEEVCKSPMSEDAAAAAAHHVLSLPLYLSLPPRPSLTRSRRSVRRAPCAAEAAGCAATRRWTAKATDLSLVDAAASDDIEEGSSSFWKNHQIFTHFYSIN